MPHLGHSSNRRSRILVAIGVPFILLWLGIAIYVGASDTRMEPGIASPAPTPTTISEAGPIPGSCQNLLDDAVASELSARKVVFTNATVLTMDSAGTRTNSVAFKAGEIVSTHSQPSIETTVSEIDLEGATVLPGFIDSHGHWIGDKDLVGQDANQAVDTALSWGWTSMSELFVSEERLGELCDLQATGDLRVKVGAFLPLNYETDRFGNWYDSYTPGQAFGPHLWIQGLKFYADRAADGLGNQTDPPSPEVQGELFWEPGELTAAFRRANEAGWQIAIHATGDGGLDLVLDAFDALGREEIVAARDRVEHLTIVRDDQIPRLRDLGLIGSIQLPWFHAGAAETLIRWVGRDRVGLTGRWRDLIDAGIPIAGSTDRPWAPVGVSGPSIPAIAQAVTRASPNGKTAPRWMRSQAMTIDEVLRSLTIDAAFAQGSDDRVGSIEEGKAADLVVLSDDPTEIATESLWDIEVLATIVDGKVEHCLKSVPPDLRKLCPEE
jgi:predicted amidohydrolase YtcJ